MMEHRTLSASEESDPGLVATIRPYLEALLMVAAATLAGLLIEPRWGSSPTKSTRSKRSASKS